MSADSSITRIGPPRPARDMLFKSYRARRFGLTASVLCLTLIGGCGGGDGADANAAQGSPAQAVAHAPPAPKPTGPLPPDAPCATPECHRRFLDDAHVHEPEANGGCLTCHEPDAGDHTYALVDTADALCAQCHDTGQRGVLRHTVLDNEGCLACHDAHTSPVPFLLVAATVEETCEQCHPPATGRWQHEPYAQGRCGACHEPHESEFAGLLRGGEGVAHCRTCHEQTVAEMELAAFAHDEVEGGCTACHGVHATDEAHLLTGPLGEQCLSCHEEVDAMAGQVVSHEPVLTGERCLSCHDAHRSDRPAMLRDEQVIVCLECHGKPVEAADGRTIPDMSAVLTESTFKHGPVGAGDCTACHSVHGSAHARLLLEPAPAALVGPSDIRNYALCFACHDQELVLAERTTVATQFRNGNLNLHAVHIRGENGGRTCTSCHTVHGSDQPRHIAEVVAYQGSDWLMPIGFVLTDTGGSCAPGCHEPLSYIRGDGG